VQNKVGDWVVPTIDLALWKKDFLIEGLRKISAASSQDLRKQLESWMTTNNVLGILFNSECKQHSYRNDYAY